MSEESFHASPDSVQRSPELLNRNCSLLLVIDLQEKLLPVIHDARSVVTGARFLMDCAGVLSVPVCVSEQYPKGLGATVDEIRGHKVVRATFEKLRFSAAEGLQEFLSDDIEQVILCGIETHVCVLQTAMDLLAQGRRVFVVADAVGSRHPTDHHCALRRLRDSGVNVCTAESVPFEWCAQAGSDEFRQISQLVRTRPSSSP